MTMVANQGAITIDRMPSKHFDITRESNHLPVRPVTKSSLPVNSSKLAACQVIARLDDRLGAFPYENAADAILLAAIVPQRRCRIQIERGDAGLFFVLAEIGLGRAAGASCKHNPA